MNTFYYTDTHITGNLINYYIQNKNFKQLKGLSSSIKKLNHLKDDYQKIISYLEKINQLSDYLYNFHDKSYNFDHFKQEFYFINKINTDKTSPVKIFLQNEFIQCHNDEKYRFFVKMVGNTKQLSNILNVKKLEIMWIANTPVWFVPYEHLHRVLNAARHNNIEIKVEKVDDSLFQL
jgi:hypothetical protein